MSDREPRIAFGTRAARARPREPSLSGDGTSDIVAEASLPPIHPAAPAPLNADRRDASVVPRGDDARSWAPRETRRSARSPSETLSRGGAALACPKVLPILFQLLELLVNDFMEYVPPASIPHLAACLGAFARFNGLGVNSSLTAVGFLWNVADALARYHCAAPAALSLSLSRKQSAARGDQRGGKEAIGLCRQAWQTPTPERPSGPLTGGRAAGRGRGPGWRGGAVRGALGPHLHAPPGARRRRPPGGAELRGEEPHLRAPLARPEDREQLLPALLARHPHRGPLTRPCTEEDQMHCAKTCD